MLSGKRFRITRPTVGLRLIDGESSIVTIPADGIIKVLSGPNANGAVHERGILYAIWDGRTVAMFAVDVQARGIEIHEQSNGSHQADQSATA